MRKKEFKLKKKALALVLALAMAVQPVAGIPFVSMQSVEAEETNLIYNPTFLEGLAGDNSAAARWSFAGAATKTVTESKIIYNEIQTEENENNWDKYFINNLTNAHFVKDKKYILSFDVKSTIEREIRYGFSVPNSFETKRLTANEETLVTMEYIPQSDSPTVEVRIQLGNQGTELASHNVTISNVNLIEDTSGNSATPVITAQPSEKVVYPVGTEEENITDKILIHKT